MSTTNTPFDESLERGLDKIFPCDCSFTKGFAYKKGDPCDGSCILAIYRERAKELFTQLHEAAVQKIFIDGKVNEIEGLYRYGHISKELYDERIAALQKDTK